MRKRQQSQNEGTPAVSQAPGNQRPNNTCCFCWCCCCSCSCLTVRNEERAETAERPTLTTKMESIQVLEEGQKPGSWLHNLDLNLSFPQCFPLFQIFLRTRTSESFINLYLLRIEKTNPTKYRTLIKRKSSKIYEIYLHALWPKDIYLDSRVREVINRNLLDPNPHMYEDAQLQIYTLMHRDSFPRFLNSQIYKSFVESTASSTSES
uniref:Regulator of G protein signaling 17 n=1 Tax=Myotis lucifugus TaxID=59463 RepID=G1QAQ3_MYOLU